jgi:hypothetical protein
MRIKQRLWLLKQIFSIALAVIWLRIFFVLLVSGKPILLEEPSTLVITAELALTLFTFAYISVETTVFIKDHVRLEPKEVVLQRDGPSRRA